MLLRILAFCLLLVFGNAFADETAVRKTFEARFPQAKVQSVSKTPYGGLYEVFMDGKIHYTDEKVSFIIQGWLVDTATSRNVTEQRMRKLTALNVKELPPLNMAIKKVKGDGSRQLMVFSDPHCTFCKRLEQELASLNNVSIYVFLYPVESKFPGSTELSKSIWCAPDRAKAWDEWMLKGQRPANKGGCANPVDQIEKIGTKLGIMNTPTMVFADGAPLPGMTRAADIDRLLTQTPR
jgi:thiol:disulfide interchange protein DsbC